MVEFEFFIAGNSELCRVLQENRSDSTVDLSWEFAKCSVFFCVMIHQVWAQEKTGSRKQSLLYSQVLERGRGVTECHERLQGSTRLWSGDRKYSEGKVEARTFIGFFRKGKAGARQTVQDWVVE